MKANIYLYPRHHYNDGDDVDEYTDKDACIVNERKIHKLHY